jgi:hypothetical protein
MSKSCLFQVTDWGGNGRVFFERRIRYHHIYEPVLILMSKLAFEVLYFLSINSAWFRVRAILFKLYVQHNFVCISALDIIEDNDFFMDEQYMHHPKKFQQNKSYILDNSFLLEFQQECSDFEQNYIHRIPVRNWWFSIVYHYCLERRGVNDCILEFDEFCDCDLI